MNLTYTTSSQAEYPASRLRQENATWDALLDAQPPLVRHFILSQAQALAAALQQRASQVQFVLPDRVVVELDANGRPGEPEWIPANCRTHVLGGLLERFTHADLARALRERLTELEQSPIRSAAIAAGLLRHATAARIVHGLLPSGRPVSYAPEDGDAIPSIPASAPGERRSALTASGDAIVESEPEFERLYPAGRPDGNGNGRHGNGHEPGELHSPYVPAARRFFLPAWVVFDDAGRLLVNSVEEAEAALASMQGYVALLHEALSIAPHIVADEVYQQKRYGMLGQLVNQGRALARFYTEDVIDTIRARARQHDLNRGLALDLPYFDDQALVLRTRAFDVIPAGRIMFVPAFIVRAVRAEEAKVAQDTRLSPSTRRHLLAELDALRQAFETNPTPAREGGASRTDG